MSAVPDFIATMGLGMKVYAFSGTFDNISDFLDISSFELDSTHIQILEEQLKLSGIGSKSPRFITNL